MHAPKHLLAHSFTFALMAGVVLVGSEGAVRARPQPVADASRTALAPLPCQAADVVPTENASRAPATDRCLRTAQPQARSVARPVQGALELPGNGDRFSESGRRYTF